MPWSQMSPMDQRTQFIADYLRETLDITELCNLYGVSRKTGYKWIDRCLHHGLAGLADRSRRPTWSPNATPEEIVQAFLEVRYRHPTWGAKKLLTIVHKRHPRRDLPGRSTVCDIAHPSVDGGLRGHVPARPSVPHLVSGSCSSPRAFGLDFLRTPSRDDALPFS